MNDTTKTPRAHADLAIKSGFDADVAIATGEMLQLIPDLVEALGGELEIAA